MRRQAYNSAVQLQNKQLLQMDTKLLIRKKTRQQNKIKSKAKQQRNYYGGAIVKNLTRQRKLRLLSLYLPTKKYFRRETDTKQTTRIQQMQYVRHDYISYFAKTCQLFYTAKKRPKYATTIVRHVYTKYFREIHHTKIELYIW